MPFGFLEMLFLGVAALIIVGPKRLPEVMKQAGRMFVHVRRTANDVRSTFDQVVREAEAEIRREELDAVKKALQPVQDVQAQVKRMLSPEMSAHMLDINVPAPPEAPAPAAPVAMVAPTPVAPAPLATAPPDGTRPVAAPTAPAPAPAGETAAEAPKGAV